MKRRFVQIAGELIEVTPGVQRQRQHEVSGDIAPYRSMITGEMIQGRAQHREHLRKHGCHEVGNEVKALMQQPKGLPDVSPQKRKELIVAQVQSMSDRQFRQALKKDIDFVKWNSRGLTK